MDLSYRAALAALGTLVVSVLAYPVLPVSSEVREIWYLAVAIAALGIGAAGLLRHTGPLRMAWGLLIAGYAGWILGDLVYTVEVNILGFEFYPLPSDTLYLSCYVLLALGLNRLVACYQVGRTVTGVLDAAIIATGAAIIAVVFVVAPLAADSSLSLFGKVVTAAYPVGDLLLLAMLVRLWTTNGARTVAFHLLVTSIVSSLIADAGWMYTTFVTGSTASAPWLDTLWMGSYIAAAVAVWSRAPLTRPELPASGSEELHAPRRRIVLLATGLALPAVALLIDGSMDGKVRWPVVGIGSLILSLLVLVRMAGLLRIVEVQATSLEALARSDALTGAPNRRTWDHELARACESSRVSNTLLSVAIIDLDHFKVYNDTHGHQAGDLLLRDAVAAWNRLLSGQALLARYGGEEFAVLFRDHTAEEAAQRVHALREVMPGEQTFSAGVALWDPSTDPATAVARADEAMYEAKRSGRDRVVIAWADDQPNRPRPRIALQPIVDLAAGREIAVEALSRFEGLTPTEAFRLAHLDGSGHALEADAIRAALVHRRPDRVLAINISLSSLLTAEVAAALPQELSGILIEITEYNDTHDTPALHRLLAQLRSRGAQYAIDDLGTGLSNLDRVLRLEPDVVKLDMSLVHNLDSPYHRAMIRAVTVWAEEVGATVCAKGVETAAQLQALNAIGVHSGQGFLFAHPKLQEPPEPRRPRDSEGQPQSRQGTRRP